MNKNQCKMISPKENKVKFKILSVSSNDSYCEPYNLTQNTVEESNRPWVSKQNCIYPQEIILQIKPCRIKCMEFLSHEYYISKKIEILLSNNNTDYSKFGFFRFEDNATNNFKARELKCVYLPCNINYGFIKIKLHAPYQNPLNTYSQVGLYFISVIPNLNGSQMVPQIYSDMTLQQKGSLDKRDDKFKQAENKNLDYSKNKSIQSRTFLRKRDTSKKGTKNNEMALGNNKPFREAEESQVGGGRKSIGTIDTNKINGLYEKFEYKIQCFEVLKKECAIREEFNKANELQKIIQIFTYLKNVILFLKKKKKRYVREENFGKAKRLKEKETKLKIITKDIDELIVLTDISKKWYYEWLVLYYKELKHYQTEIDEFLSKEDINHIKITCGLNTKEKTNMQEDLIHFNEIIEFLSSDFDKKRERGFDLAYKPLYDIEKNNKNFWCDNLESLCLIVKRGLSDSSYSIFLKSTDALEKVLYLFKEIFEDKNNENANFSNEPLAELYGKYFRGIMICLLKRFNDSNLEMVDVCIKSIMMLLHNNFTSFKKLFSIISSLLFYNFSGDKTSSINDKVIATLMSFYYSLINKYYSLIKDDIDVKKILDMLALFLEVDCESIKKTSVEFYVILYNTVENCEKLFEEFLSNLPAETKSLIIQKINVEEKQSNQNAENSDFSNIPSYNMENRKGFINVHNQNSESAINTEEKFLVKKNYETPESKNMHFSNNAQLIKQLKEEQRQHKEEINHVQKSEERERNHKNASHRNISNNNILENVTVSDKSNEHYKNVSPTYSEYSTINEIIPKIEKNIEQVLKKEMSTEGIAKYEEVYVREIQTKIPSKCNENADPPILKKESIPKLPSLKFPIDVQSEPVVQEEFITNKDFKQEKELYTEQTINKQESKNQIEEYSKDIKEKTVNHYEHTPNEMNKKEVEIEVTVEDKEINPGLKIYDSSEFHLDEDIPPFTCKYCRKTNATFTEIGLEKHWIKKCPMLCTCPNCFLIIELVVINEHLLSECSQSHLYTSCEHCNKVIKKDTTKEHLRNECTGEKTEFLSCYFCSLHIKSFDIDVWREHFLSCSSNPRFEK